MAGGKIDILIDPDVKDFPAKLESGLKGGVAKATAIGSAIGVALGGAATVKSIATLGIEFDSQMNTLSAVSQATAPQLEMVEQAARDLGKSADLTATSASDAAAAMTELVKGGFSIQEAMDAAKGTLQLASAAQIEAADAATIQSQALQAFGLDASYAATASDILAGAANASSAEIQGISNGLQQSGAVANQFGLTLEDNATALAMFANAGIQGSDAGTLLKTALLSMTKDSGPARAAIEDLGLTIYDAQGRFVGMEKLFGELSDASERMTEEQYQAASAALFGSDAMRMAGVAAAQGAEGWNETYAAVTRAGQASEVAAAQASGLPGLLEAVENQAEDTGLAIYSAFSGLALEVGGRLVGLLEQAGPMVESAARGIASGIESALPTVERIVAVVGEGVQQIGSGLGVLGGAGMSMLSSLGRTLGPIAENALSLSEGLGSMTGPLLAAGAALVVGRWRGWGTAVEASVKSLQTKRQGLSDMIPVYQRLAEAEGHQISRLQATMSIMERQYPVLGRMADAYRSSGVELRSWGQQTQLAGASVEGLGGMMSTAAGTAARFGGALQGVAAGGMSLARDGVKGLMSALGGPWNLALAGAAMAVSGITAEIDKTRRSADLLRELGDSAEVMGDQLFAAMAKGDLTAEIDALNSGIDGMIAKYEELSQTAPNVWGYLAAAFKDLGVAFSDGPSATALLDEQKAVAENAEMVTKALQDAGISAEEAATAVGGSAAQYDALISSLDLTTQEGQQAAAALQEQRDAYLEMQDLTDSLAPGSVELSEAMAKIGDEAASAEERVSALSDALDQMLGIDPTADEAIAGLHEEIDQVTDAAQRALDQTKGFGEALLGGDGVGGLDYANANALKLRDTLLGMRDSLMDVAIAEKDVGEARRLQQPALEALATQYGLSTAQVEALATSFGLVPDLIESTVEVSTNEALEGLEEVYAAVEAGSIEAEEPITLKVDNVEDSKSQIEALGGSIEEVHTLADGSGAIEFTVAKDAALWDIQSIVSAMAQVSSEKGITFTSNSEEQIAAIRKLGIDITKLENGQYKIDSNSPEEIAHLLEIGLLLEDEKTGEITVNSNLDEVLEKGRELDERDGRQTHEQHTVTRLERTIRSHEIANSAGGRQGLSRAMQADGSVRFAAEGMLSEQEAQMASGGRWITWAEDETRGESFIPHAMEKRHRSTQILAETANLFGLGLVNREGSLIQRDGTSVAALPGSQRHFANGGIIENLSGIAQEYFPELSITSTLRPGEANHHGWGEAIDISNQRSGGPSTPEMQRAAQFFYDNYASMLAELIHWPLNGWQNIEEGQPFDFGPGVNAQHTDHVHIATRNPLPPPGEGPGAGPGLEGSASRSWGVVPGTQGSMQSRETRSMSWSTAPDTRVDFGSASRLHADASAHLGLPDREKVNLGATRTTQSYSTSPGEFPRVVGGGGDGDFGEGHQGYVAAITTSAQDHGLPEKGAMIGVGTAFVEAGNPIKNYANRAVPASLDFPHDAIGSDHDSVGIFQQRDNGAWGTLEQRMDPYQSAGLFFDAMLSKFPHWESMEPGAVAQGVQVSAFPDRYATQMDAALEAVRATGLYDAGGWLQPRSFAFNASGAPEPILNASQWQDISHLPMLVQQMPPLVQSIQRLVPAIEGVATAGRAGARAGETSEDVSTITEIVRAQTSWLDNTKIVMDAERGLAQTRAQAAADVETLTKAEAQLLEAQDNLTHAQSQSASLSTSMQRRVADAEEALAEARGESVEKTTAETRKLEDAEAALAKARAGDDAEKIADAETKLARVREDLAESSGKKTREQAEKIADAELKLARVREDAAEELAKNGEKQTEEQKKAAEDVAKAEEALAAARTNAESSLLRIEAAERAVVAARLQAINQLATAFGSALTTMTNAVAGFYSAMADAASMMERTRQQLVAERAELQRLTMARRRSQLDVIIAEQDLAKAKAEGAISVADAEAHLGQTRMESMGMAGESAVLGATGIDAMSVAMDRARVTGKFAVEEVSRSMQRGAAISTDSSYQSAQAAEDAAQQQIVAEHNVAAARAQADLDEFTATHQHRIAVLELARSTLLQQQAVALVEVSTKQLAAQAEILGGLTSGEAAQASTGWGGLGQAGGGLLGLAGSFFTGAASLSTGNVLGVVTSIGTGLKSVLDIVTGARDAWDNRDQIVQSWEGMDGLDKAVAVLGTLSGVVVTGASAVAAQEHGAEVAIEGAKVGAELVKDTAAYVSEGITKDVERINNLADSERETIRAQVDKELLKVDQAITDTELEYAKGSVALQAEVDIAGYLARIAEADTTAQADALAAAAIVAAERREQMLDLLDRQVEIAEKNAATPRASLTVNIPPGAKTVDRSEFEALVDTVARIDESLDVRKTEIGGTNFVTVRT